MDLRFRSACLGLVLTQLVACVGCGGASLETPEGTFQTIRMAAHNNDMRGLFTCLTDESLDTLAGMLLVTVKAPGGMAAMSGDLSPADAEKAKAAADAVCEEHGVSDKAVRDKLANPLALLSSGGLRSVSAQVKDKVDFIADMWAALEPFGQMSKFSDQFTAQIAGQLTDVQIDGDQASATVVTEAGAKAPIAFRKTPAGWKVHIELGPGGVGAAPAA